MLPVAVLAGGLGTRMTTLTGTSLPKVLVKVAGRPFIDFKLAELAAQGIERVVLLLGHAAPRVMEYVGDGRRFGLSIDYSLDGEEPRGTGGAVRKALPLLGERFWVTYGDSYLRAPMRTIEDEFVSSGTDGVMVVIRNRNEWDQSNTKVEDGLVVDYWKGAPEGTFEYADYGLSLFRREAFAGMEGGEPLDLGEVVGLLIEKRNLSAFETDLRFYHIGDPEAFRETEDFLVTNREWERLASLSNSRQGDVFTSGDTFADCHRKESQRP